MTDVLGTFQNVPSFGSQDVPQLGPGDVPWTSPFKNIVIDA